MSGTSHASATGGGINQVSQLPLGENRKVQQGSCRSRTILRASSVTERTHWPAGVRRKKRNKPNLPEAEDNIT